MKELRAEFFHCLFFSSISTISDQDFGLSASNSFELFEHRFNGMTIIGIPGQGKGTKDNSAVSCSGDRDFVSKLIGLIVLVSP